MANWQVNQWLDSFPLMRDTMNIKKWQLQFTRFLLSIILLVCSAQAVPIAQKSQKVSSFRAPVLRAIDKVELMSIYSRMGDIESVDATKVIEGAAVQEIVRI